MTEPSNNNTAPAWGGLNGSLSKLPKERFKKLQEELPRLVEELPPAVPRQLAHLPGKTTTVEEVIAYFARDGAVIIDELVDPKICDQTMYEMKPYLDAATPGSADFLGAHTKRCGAILARSRTSHEIILNPLILDVAQGVLGHQVLNKGGPEMAITHRKEGHPIQLNVAQVIEIHPGEPAQPIHRDVWSWGWGEGTFRMAELDIQLSMMWALGDYIEGAGPTNAVPGSHKWPAGADDKKRMGPKGQEELYEQAAHAVMKKGSVMLYSTNAFHGGGANTSKDTLRKGMHVSYILGWLRQEENMYLSCPPDVAKDMSPGIQHLLGYSRAGNGLGYFADFQDPMDTFSGPKVNWADPQKNESKL